MVIKHYLNGTEIDEPIGFDNLKMTMKRGDYHGMSAEVSEQTLEFYGTAADIVRSAYKTDIDTEVTYRVVTTDDEEMYSGVLDLSTYEEQCSEYCSVSCKVGEIGVKTTFNNRTDTDIDLNTTQTIDGLSLAHTYPWHNLTLPRLRILYTNELIQKKDTLITSGTNTDGKTALTQNHLQNFISIFPSKVKFNEYGELGSLVNVITGSYENMQNYKDIVYTDHEDMKLWQREYTDEWDNDYGNVSKHSIEADIKVNLKFLDQIFAYKNSSGEIVLAPLKSNDWLLHCRLILVAKNTIIAQGDEVTFYDNGDGTNEVGVEKTLTLTCSTTANVDDTLFLGILFTHTNLGAQLYLQVIYALNTGAEFNATILKGSYIRTKMYDNIEGEDVKADMLLLHEALNKVSEVISENALTVKSDLYSRSDSVINKHTADSSESTFEKAQGIGALRALTNGYKMRGLYTDSENERNMPMSFKTLIESLDALDCIGWGFSTESGITYIRVERWSWFYKTGDPILVIKNPNSVKTSIDTSLIISELTIGYKKYLTNEDIASIDNIMSERTFTTSTKAISNTVSKLCEFIADNYAAELTRRAAIEKEADEEFQYDENIFIFSLKRDTLASEIKASTDSTTAAISTTETYSIPPDINTADSSVLNPTEVYNAKISPARNAYRWIDRLFCVAGLQPFTCTSGNVNYKAQITTTPQPDRNLVYITPDPVNDIPTYTVLDPSGSQIASGIKQNPENLTLRERYYKTYQVQAPKPMAGVKSDDDLIIPRIFKAETIEFTYPLSVAEYKKVKANPYGLIEVDGVLGWIKEFSYSFSDGEATFKLIPKAD